METNIKTVLQWAQQKNFMSIVQAFVLPNRNHFIGGVWPGLAVRGIRISTYPSPRWGELPQEKLLTENDAVPGSPCTWLTILVESVPCMIEIRYVAGKGNTYCFIPSQDESRHHDFARWVALQKRKKRYESLGLTQEHIKIVESAVDYEFCYQTSLFAWELLANCQMNFTQCLELLQEVTKLPASQKQAVLQPYIMLAPIPIHYIGKVVKGASLLIAQWQVSGAPRGTQQPPIKDPLIEEIRKLRYPLKGRNKK